MFRSRIAPLLDRFEHIVVPAAYALIALVMSFPLVAQFGDHIAGVDGDVWSYLWAMGWARISLLDLGTNPFHSDYIFYPLGGASQLLWGTALPSFASIPLQVAFGLVPAFNVAYLAASVLTAYGMYLLAKQELKQLKSQHQISLKFDVDSLICAAFLAGIIFAFGALRLGYGLAFTNLFHTEFIPFYVLFLLRATRNGGWKNAILGGIFFALNVYVDFQIAAFLAVLTGLWFLVAAIGTVQREMGKAAQARDGLRVRDETTMPFLRWVALAAVAVVLSLPMLGFVLQDFAIEGGNYIRVYPLRYSADRSYDLLSFVLPNARSTLYAGFGPRVEGVNASVNTEGDSELSPDRQAFLGVTVIVLALIGAVRFRRAWWFWIGATLLFAILSLGPVLHVAGNNTGIPLPFVIANYVPILNHIRIPMRYGLMVFFGAALLAGAGAVVLMSWRQWVWVPLGALILVEAAVFPYPTLEFRVSPVYEQIGREPDDFSVLEVPSFNWRYAAKNEAYQTIHQKRILRAYTNRIAPDIADYFNLRQTPVVVRSLRILEGAEKGVLTENEIAQDRAVLDSMLHFFNLKYAIVHRDQLDAASADKIELYLRDVMKGQVFYHDDAVTAYQFARTSPDARTLDLDLADNSNLMYLGRGWQTEPLAQVDDEQGRYLKPGASEIYFPGRTIDNRMLSLRLLNRGQPSDMLFVIDNHPLNVATLENGWQEVTLPVRDEVLPPLLSRFVIRQNAAIESIATSTVVIK